MSTATTPKLKLSARTKTKMIPWMMVGPALLMLTLVIVYPILMVVKYSFTENMLAVDNPQFIWFENYKTVLADPRLIKMLIFTPLFTFGSVILHTIIGLFFAMQLNNVKIKPRVLTVYRVIFVLPWVFTAAVVAVVWQLMMSPQGVINTILGMASGSKVLIEWLGNAQIAMFSIILINAWRGYPTCMVSFLAALQNIPVDMYEAADIDGAGPIRKFFSLTLPQLKSVILSVGVLDAIWTMNLFPLIWLTTGGGPSSATDTVATLTYRMAFVEFEFGEASALAVVGLLLTLAGVMVYLKLQKNVNE